MADDGSNDDGGVWTICIFMLLGVVSFAPFFLMIWRNTDLRSQLRSLGCGGCVRFIDRHAGAPDRYYCDEVDMQVLRELEQMQRLEEENRPRARLALGLSNWHQDLSHLTENMRGKVKLEEITRLAEKSSGLMRDNTDTTVASTTVNEDDSEGASDSDDFDCDYITLDMETGVEKLDFTVIEEVSSSDSTGGSSTGTTDDMQKANVVEPAS